MRRVALAVALLVASACGGNNDDDDATATSVSTATSTTTTGPATTDATDAPAPLADVDLRLTEIAQLEQPLAMAVRRGTPGVYVAGKGGLVYHLREPNAEPEVVLDISDQVTRGGEQGLLGLAISPDGSKLYLSYTNTDGDTRVDEHDLANGDVREVFAIEQPYANHNGGNILFGPDGLLWLGLGDGGSGGDPHDNAQDPDTLLGKLIRFDPADPRPQIYALGLRNPWRFSFDRETDDLWIGDVGQGAVEEIDLVAAGTPPGVNLGWNLLEGTRPFEATEAPGTLLPIHEYGRGEGQSVAGGYVYRGSKIPALRGIYVFADTYTAELRLLRRSADGAVEHRATGVRVDGMVGSFGEDADGELYVLSLAGGVYRIDP